jgi:hypothetical protein
MARPNPNPRKQVPLAKTRKEFGRVRTGKAKDFNPDPRRSVGGTVAAQYHPEIRDAITSMARSGQDADAIDQAWAAQKIASRVPSTESIEALMQVPPGGYNASLSKRQFKGYDPVRYMEDQG